MYVEDKPVAMSETDRLMAKVEEYKAMVEQLIPKTEVARPEEDVEPEPTTDNQTATTNDPVAYKDKSEVIAELTKRQIKFDARKSKAELEKLLV
jgi:hypothetical protein